MWLWASADARTALETRNLATILRTYRRINALSQRKLGELLGFDPTYVSMLETGRRDITDVKARRVIAEHLALPPHALGVTTRDDGDFAAMIQFGESTLRLADIARSHGHAVDAVDELWPLVARLEAHAAEGMTEAATLALLARARHSLGIALGHVLPDEKLSTAAKWTGKAWAIARHLDDRSLQAHTAAAYGNELRKSGRHSSGMNKLREALARAVTQEQRAQSTLFLARAAGEAGDPELFDHAMWALDHCDHANTAIVNPLSIEEVRLRGLIDTGRASTAAKYIGDTPTADPHASPQWHVIMTITTGQVLSHSGDHTMALQLYQEAISAAVLHQLPHQLQRIIKLAGSGDSATAARAALESLPGQHPLL